MDEKLTRQQIIDEKLRLAGWNVHDPSHVTEELDIDLTGRLRVADPKTKYDGHQFVDYGLLLSARLAAVVEAKRTSKDAELGQEQALQYAQNIQKVYGGDLPLVMYSNGHDIFYWESEFYPPVRVHGFPTRDDLEWMAQRCGARKPLC